MAKPLSALPQIDMALSTRYQHIDVHPRLQWIAPRNFVHASAAHDDIMVMSGIWACVYHDDGGEAAHSGHIR